MKAGEKDTPLSFLQEIISWGTVGEHTLVVRIGENCQGEFLCNYQAQNHINTHSIYEVLEHMKGPDTQI